MQIADLEKEIRSQRDIVAELRIAVRLGKEKDVSKYYAAKRQLARMLTILQEKHTTPTPVAA